MVHLLSQLDPMVWLMMVVVAIGFVVSAVVLVELLPRGDDDPPVYSSSLDGRVDTPGVAGDEQQADTAAPLL